MRHPSEILEGPDPDLSFDASGMGCLAPGFWPGGLRHGQGAGVPAAALARKISLSGWRPVAPECLKFAWYLIRRLDPVHGP